MIAPLRRRHRWFIAVLLVLLPVGYVAALLARPLFPQQSAAPVAPIADPAVGILLHEDLSALDGRLIVRLLEGAPRAAEPVLELAPVDDLRLPDVLVYWSAAGNANPATDAGLPSSARLLGTLGGLRARRFSLPSRVRDGASSLVLYSLAHNEVVGSHPLPLLPGDHR